MLKTAKRAAQNLFSRRPDTDVALMTRMRAVGDLLAAQGYVDGTDALSYPCAGVGLGEPHYVWRKGQQLVVIVPDKQDSGRSYVINLGVTSPSELRPHKDVQAILESTAKGNLTPLSVSAPYRDMSEPISARLTSGTPRYN